MCLSQNGLPFRLTYSNITAFQGFTARASVPMVLFPRCTLLPPNNSQGPGCSSLVDPQSPKLIIRALLILDSNQCA
ncbi:hypothetical protein K443DRAFT_664981 [Laccaria amethystina LaAM-08-1]|uniref:Uncharacterized protein n=1 Tax=Laccaria amethystina LaAM-08-1 TaxID=1095629 RepID=A0A0C9WKX5_9AGAR|nr:hypothetical protein K443DRAFT_664981 [Laccaria amethystina LaAM-08-1]